MPHLKTVSSSFLGPNALLTTLFKSDQNERFEGGGEALISSPTHSSQQFQNCPIRDEEYLACTLVPIFSSLSFTLFRMQAATNRIWNVLYGRLEQGETLWWSSTLKSKFNLNYI